VARQISREEFMARFGGGERPQPLNTPGLPAADAARAKAELEILQEMADAAGGRTKGDFITATRVGKKTTIRKGAGGNEAGGITYKSKDGAETYNTRDLINRRQAAIELERQRQMESMALERAKTQAGTQIGQVQDVVNAATGANLDPQSALRVAQLAEVLEVDASTALQVLAAEQQKMRSLDDPRAQQMLEEVSKRSEVPLERDNSYEQLDAIEDATDQMLAARALDAVAPQTRAMSEPERRMIAAELGIGRKSMGTGQMNLVEKVRGEVPPDPYLVPVLLGEPVPETSVNKEGESRTYMQPRTYVDPKASKRGAERRFDARQVQLGLLDPRARLNPDVAAQLGYVYPISSNEAEQKIGSKIENAPTFDPALRNPGENEGFRPQDDPAVQRERQMVPMTLGQAINQIVEANRTPLALRTEGMIREDDAGRMFDKGTGKEVFLRGDYQGMDNYRIGKDSQYTNKMYRDINELLRAETGMELIANQRLQDPAMNRIQRAMLERSMAEGTRVIGPETRRQAKELFPGKQVPMGKIEGENPLFDIIGQLKEGRNIPPSLVAERGILASTNTPEGEFYRRLVGQQIVGQREKVKAIQADAARNAAVNAAGSAVPAKAAPISDTYDLSNAPASQQAPQNKDQNMAQTMIGNVLRSLGL